MTKRLAIGLLLLCINVFSETNNRTLILGEDGNIPDDLQIGRAYLELINKTQKIRQLDTARTRIETELEGTGAIALAMEPLIKTIPAIDTIDLHPKRTVTVLLPDGAEIVYAKPNFQCKIFEYDRASNMLIIQPKPDFISGDITITYALGTENQTIKIISKKYIQEDDKKFYPLISYLKYRTATAYEIVEAYKKEYGEYPVNKYSFISLGGEAYKIVEDLKYGTVSMPNGKKYRIEAKKISR